MRKLSKDESIKALMSSLDISEQEATQLWEDDQEDYESEEMKEMAKKSKAVQKQAKAKEPKAEKDKTKMAGVTTQKRAKKENPTKALIIDTIQKALSEVAEIEGLEVANKEKTILFKLGDNTFEIDLKQKRKPKGA